MQNQSIKDKKIDKYYFKFTDLLGKGSFAEVYKGLNMLTKEQIAIKMVDKHLINRSDYLRQGLLAEIRIMQTLNSPCVVRLLDVLETTNNYYLIQEFCDGGTLQTQLSQKKMLTENEVKSFLIDILTGFIVLIKNGVVHRDLKPANILLHQGRYKLADFGFAKMVADFQTDMLTSAVGTPLYMSPQILANDKYTNKTDIWSLGFILYQALYGKQVPWSGMSIQQLLGNIKKQPLLFPSNPQISQELKDLITRCLIIEECKKRLSWDQLYQHQVVEKNFKQLYMKEDNIVNSSIYLKNDIRQKIFQENINIIEVIKKIGIEEETLNYNQFKSLILNIEPQTSDLDIKNLFYEITQQQEISKGEILLFFKQTDKIDLQQIPALNQQNLPHLQQGGPHQYGQQIPLAFFKLENEMKKQNIHLEELFKDYLGNIENILTSEDIYILLKKIDLSLTDQEISQAEKYMENSFNYPFTFQSLMENLQNILMKVSQQIPHEKEGTKINQWGQTKINEKPKSVNLFFWQKKSQ